MAKSGEEKEKGNKPESKGEEGKPSYVEVTLASFIQNNPTCVVSLDKKTIVIDKPWGATDVRLRVSIEDHEGIKDLNNVILNPRFDAIYHVDEKRVEFFLGYLDPKDENAKSYMDRKFTVHFDGVNYECLFAPPSDRLLRIAKNSEPVPADPSPTRIVPQLPPFRDVQNLEKMPPFVKEWFAPRVPRNFYLKPQTDVELKNAAQLARHINFLIRYYDRLAPRIIVRDEPSATAAPAIAPLRMIEGHFPKTLFISPIDDIVLRLMEVARESPPRFGFVYYYQVLEYVGYYYLDEKIRRSLRTFLKDPAVANCGEDQISELISMFADTAHNDDAKMRKAIEEHCDPKAIWKEVEHHRDFFTIEQKFDGGFVLPALIAPDTTASSWNAMWMPRTYEVMTKVRNALVHAREKRENRVILPTAANNARVRQVLPVMGRIAEQLVLKAAT